MYHSQVSDNARNVSRVANGNAIEAAAFDKPGMIVTMPVDVGYDINNDEADELHHFPFITAQFCFR
jgi:hypothetical protein